MTTTKLDTVERDVEGREYVVVDVTSPKDVLGDDVFIALTPRGETTTTWLEAEWAPSQQWEAGSPVACRVLVGPESDTVTTAAVLARGTTYLVKVRITDNPEAPVFPAYLLKGV